MFIQCKYYDKPLGKNPIQEVLTGAAFYGNTGKPVVITNNEVTIYAKKLGVEIIADSEWEEIKEAYYWKNAVELLNRLDALLRAKICR